MGARRHASGKRRPHHQEDENAKNGSDRLRKFSREPIDTRCRLLSMRIATFNVNGINGRLPVLLRWLSETSPDMVRVQELEAPDAKFPRREIEAAGYGAIWHGQPRWNGVAMLAKGIDPIETRRCLPGDETDGHSSHIEAAVRGVLIAKLYMPNGNPAPGRKYDYKLAWFDRFISHAAELLRTGAPIVLAGDYNVMPTDLDVYKPERWRDDALFRIEVRDAFRRLDDQSWTDSIRHLHPEETDLHVLGLSQKRLGARRGPTTRPPNAQPLDCGPIGRCWRGSRSSWLAQCQQPRASVDRAELTVHPARVLPQFPRCKTVFGAIALLFMDAQRFRSIPNYHAVPHLVVAICPCWSHSMCMLSD